MSRIPGGKLCNAAPPSSSCPRGRVRLGSVEFLLVSRAEISAEAVGVRRGAAAESCVVRVEELLSELGMLLRKLPKALESDFAGVLVIDGSEQTADFEFSNAQRRPQHTHQLVLCDRTVLFCLEHLEGQPDGV